MGVLKRIKSCLLACFLPGQDDDDSVTDALIPREMVRLACVSVKKQVHYETFLVRYWRVYTDVLLRSTKLYATYCYKLGDGLVFEERLAKVINTFMYDKTIFRGAR